MKKPSFNSRRQFLKDTANTTLALSVLDSIFGSMLFSARNQAMAAATGNFKNFLHLDLYSAPPRWCYDLFLNPKNVATDFVANKMVSNHYVSNNGVYSSAQYKLVRHASGHYVPYLWSLQVPKAGGGTQRAWNLLDNMLNIRGIDALNAGHPGASQLHQQGVVGAPTTTSLTSDRAAASTANPTLNVIRSLVLNPTPGATYMSKKGYAQFRHDANDKSNQLARLFASLRPLSVANGFDSTFIKNNTALEDQIKDALDALEPKDKKYYQSLLDTSDSSMKILTDDTITVFSQLTKEWDVLFNKYSALITTVIATEYVGINDRPVGRKPADALEGRAYQFNRDNFISNEVNGKVDLRSMLSTVSHDKLAAQFAVTEFLMTRGLAPSIHLYPTAFLTLSLNGGKSVMPFDQHFTGFMPGIVLNSIYYLCLTSCLLELIQQLKASNVFNDTLIYMSSEFNRSPRVDGSGSDHGVGAAHVSLLSGRIANFKIAGNIYRDSAGKNLPQDATYKGTWGYGAPINGEQLNIVQVWGSVMKLLGMPVGEIPNAVSRSHMLFPTAGSLSLASGYNGAPQTIANVSK